MTSLGLGVASQRHLPRRMVQVLWLLALRWQLALLLSHGVLRVLNPVSKLKWHATGGLNSRGWIGDRKEVLTNCDSIVSQI